MGGDALIVLAQKAAEFVIPEAMKSFLEKRRSASFDILVEALRTANIDADEVAKRDDVAAMFVKFYQAMAQGAAFANLRLIAKVLAYKVGHKEERTDDFIMWADTIGGLLTEEAVLLAALHRNYEAAILDQTQLNHVHGRAMTTLQQELIGPQKTFADKDSFEATGTSLIRTGFVILVSGYGGGMSFAPSPRLSLLANLARLDDWANEAATS
jgi:hypothetical protein